MALDSHAWKSPRDLDPDRAAVAGGIGGGIAVVAWFLGIPVLSGILVLIGGFMVVMAVYTFTHEGRKALKTRR